MISDEEAKEIKKQLLEQISKLPKEQVPGLKEKIESMGNKELEQFVKQQTKQTCIFCQIVQGKAKTYKVYEDNNFVAVLDIMPATKGHTIIIPKKHVQFLTQLSDDETKEFFLLAKKIIPIIIQITKCQGIDLYISQGIKQRIPHLALNLIPRYPDDKDKVSFDWERKPAQEKELQEISKQISIVLNQIAEREHSQKQETIQKEEESEAQKMIKHVHERMP